MRLNNNVIFQLMERDCGNHITDYADEYGEPGYDNDGPILFGSWWCRDQNCRVTKKLEAEEQKRKEEGDTRFFSTMHTIMDHHPRFWAALEEQFNVEVDWYDEWVISHESSPSKAYRTTGDSYMWQSSILWTNGDFLTPDDDITDWVEEVVNNPRKTLPSHVWSDSQLEELGFEEYQCGYENGWHPGQTDNPVEISKIIKAEYEEQGKEVDILYKLSYVSQFDLGFCVFVREQNSEVDV